MKRAIRTAKKRRFESVKKKTIRTARNDDSNGRAKAARKRMVDAG